jgi:hypothetical protein
MRDTLGLKKTKKKMADVFEAHCVDSWVLANAIVGGRATGQYEAPMRVAAPDPSPGAASSPAWRRRGAITLRRNAQSGVHARFDRSSSQVWHRLRRRCFGRTNQSPSRGRR